MKSDIIVVQNVPKDDVLPQLSLALDTSVMKDRFQSTLFETDLEQDRYRIKDCHITQIRHIRGKACTICYRLTVHDIQADAYAEQIECVRLFGQGVSLARFHKAHTQHLVTPRFGKALTHIPDLEMVAWAFPNDLKIETLPSLVDEKQLKDHIIPKIILANCGNEWTLKDMTNEVVHYVGEHTCTVRVQAELSHAHTDDHQELVLYGKTYYNDEGAEAYRLMQQLWESPAKQEGQLRMAKPLWYDPELKTLWQQGLSGMTLIEYGVKNPDMVPLLERTGMLVAALHGTSLTCTKKIEDNTIFAKLKKSQASLANAKPSCQAILDPLVERLLVQLGKLEPQASATLHGDLHFKNIFVESEGVALIDLDSLCTGPPLQEIGSFLAGLFYRGIFERAPRHIMNDLAAVFVREYTQHVPWPVSPSDIAWYTASALVTERAYRCVTRLKAGRFDLVDDLLTLANQMNLGGFPINS